MRVEYLAQEQLNTTGTLDPEFNSLNISHHVSHNPVQSGSVNEWKFGQYLTVLIDDQK